MEVPLYDCSPPQGFFRKMMDNGTVDHGTLELIKKNIKETSRRRVKYDLKHNL